MNIARKGIGLDTRCVLCHKMFEDGGHLFFHCKHVKPIWRGLQLEDVRLSLMQCHGPLKVLEKIHQLPEKNKLTVVALLWAWWTERNKENHKEKRRSTEDMPFLVRHHVDEWIQFYKPKPRQASGDNPVWQPPPDDFIILNTNGAFVETDKISGWGAIARDRQGTVIFAAAGKILNACDAMHAEALAVMHGIRQADRMGIGRIVVATDSLNLKQALTSSSYDQAKLGHLFLDIKYHLTMEFHDYAVQYCPRACNKPTHLLAALGMRESRTDQLMWLSDYPNDVSRLVTDDLVVS
ncbi:unnamed protein product [Alopecurus aequalis]